MNIDAVGGDNPIKGSPPLSNEKKPNSSNPSGSQIRNTYNRLESIDVENLERNIKIAKGVGKILLAGTAAFGAVTLASIGVASNVATFGAGAAMGAWIGTLVGGVSGGLASRQDYLETKEAFAGKDIDVDGMEIGAKNVFGGALMATGYGALEGTLFGGMTCGMAAITFLKSGLKDLKA